MEQRSTEDERATRGGPHDGAADGAGDGRGHMPAGEAGVCGICPVCAVLATVTAARPEITQHLLTAARELVAAMSAALDAYPGAPPGTCSRTHRTAPPQSGSLRRIAVE
jgi:hypothetical protein